MIGVRRAAASLLVVLCLPAIGAAQTVSRGRYELSGGVQWIGSIGIAAAPANETTAGGGVRPLFRSETTVDRSVGAGASLGIRLSRALTAEGRVAYAPTHLTTNITDDTETTSPPVIDEPLKQIHAEGGVVAQLTRWRRGRVQPFATAGLSYVRFLHDGRTLIESGRALYLGGGLYYERASARPRRLQARGLRIDVRAVSLRGGVAADDRYHTGPALTASVFARF